MSGRGGRYRFERMVGADLLCSQSVAGIGGLPMPAGLAETVPAALAVVGSRLSHAALPVSSSYDTSHRPSQVLPVLVPISQRIFHLYSDRRARTDDRFAVPERSSVDTHQGPTHAFDGGKGFQLNYRPYSNYWPYWWRCWISLLEVHQ